MGGIAPTRFWEIDALRGIAIIMMIIFHILFNLKYFEVLDIKLYSGPMFFFWLPIPFIFLMLVGVSMTLKKHRTVKPIKKEKRERGIVDDLPRSYIKRGFKILFFALLITAVTWMVIGDGFIIFGILHLIGLSMILSIPFVDKKYFSFFTGVVLIMAGLVMQTFRVKTYWLLVFGIRPFGFYTLDYFPLLPWMGVVLIGIFLGNTLYTNYERQYRLPDISKNILVRSLGFLGRHSLLIYLVHQPIIITAFVLMGLVEVGQIIN